MTSHEIVLFQVDFCTYFFTNLFKNFFNLGPSMCQALFMALGGGAVIKINDLLLWSLHSSSRKQIRRQKKAN